MQNDILPHHWSAEEYACNSSVQHEAALQLLQQLQLSGSERVLDVGCGDGKITAKIAEKVNRGDVVGIDLSPDMIEFARKSFEKTPLHHLSFLKGDAQYFELPYKVDCIFSSFCIQWLKKPNLFFENARRYLTERGIIAITVPLGVSSELEFAISQVITRPMWSNYFQTFNSGWYFLGQDDYRHLLVQNGFELMQFSAVLHQVVFHSVECFKQYLLPWFSYLDPIPPELQDAFFEEIVREYLIKSPVREDGSVHFAFLRLDVVASKVDH